MAKLDDPEQIHTEPEVVEIVCNVHARSSACFCNDVSTASLVIIAICLLADAKVLAKLVVEELQARKKAGSFSGSYVRIGIEQCRSACANVW